MFVLRLASESCHSSPAFSSSSPARLTNTHILALTHTVNLTNTHLRSEVVWSAEAAYVNAERLSSVWVCIHQGNQASADGESSLQEQIRSTGSHTAVTELLPIMGLRGAGGGGEESMCICVCVFTCTQTCPSASCHLFCMACVHACMLM